VRRAAVRRRFLLAASSATLRAVPRRYDSEVREADFFSGLAPVTLRKICEAYTVRTMQDGASFFRETEAAQTVYLLVEGRVTMNQLSESGQQVTMRVIAAGQMFGGVAILGPKGGYPAAALAVGAATALAWKGTLFKELALHDPALGLRISELMYGHLEEMQTRFRELATERVEQRVARTLLRLAAQEAGSPTEPGSAGTAGTDGGVTLRLRRQEIAEMAGTTLFTVSRLLSEWERQGAINAGRGRVVILSAAALKAIAEDNSR
jgi:CRP/FNR family transcriptional regulator, nitrogen oxide reductase regulator